MVISRRETSRTRWIRSSSSGRRDRALHQRDVVRPLDHGPGGLGEVGDLDLTGQRDQLVLAVEQGQLAAVARGELPHRELRAAVRRAGGSRVAVGGGHGSQLRSRHEGFEPVVGQHRAVHAQEAARGAGSDRTAPRRTSCCAPWTAARRSRGTPRSTEGRRGVPHHHLGTADQGQGARRVELGPLDELGDQPDAAPPGVRAAVDDHLDGDVVVVVPSGAGRRRRGCPRGCARRTGATTRWYVVAGRAHLEDRRAQRRQPDAAGDEDHVAPAAVAAPPTRCRTGPGRRAWCRACPGAGRGRPSRRRGSCAGACPGCAGSPLIEIGTSPTPNAWSMVNCPASNASGSPSTGSRSQGVGVAGCPGASR